MVLHIGVFGAELGKNQWAGEHYCQPREFGPPFSGHVLMVISMPAFCHLPRLALSFSSFRPALPRWENLGCYYSSSVPDYGHFQRSIGAFYALSHH